MSKAKTSTKEEIERVQYLVSLGHGQREIERETGLSRRQIAKIVNSDVAEKSDFDFEEPQRMSTDGAARAVHELSIRPQGVKNSELSAILAAHFGYRKNKDTGARELNMTKAQLDYLKKKARAISSPSLQPLFVPEWLPRTAPTAAFNILLGHASDLQDRITEIVMDFCEQFPDSSPSMIYEELVRIAVSSTTKEPVERRCERNMLAAGELETRWEGASKLFQRTPLRPIIDAEFDTICM